MGGVGGQQYVAEGNQHRLMERQSIKKGFNLHIQSKLL